MTRTALAYATIFTLAALLPASTWASVAEQIQAAQPGDTVVIAPGHYDEHGIVVDKPLVLLGQGDVVIDAGGEGEIITVTADGVTVSGFILKNVGTSFMEDRAAIRLSETIGCTIADNILINAFFGVYLENSGGSVVRGNTITGRAERETTSGNGIHLWYCRDIHIEDNQVEGHRDGIYFEFVEDSYVTGNISRNNLRYGLHFMFSHDDTYEDNTFSHNGAGVAVMYSQGVSMRHNRFERNWGQASYGLLLKEIKDSVIEQNRIERNTIGLYSEGSDRVIVEGNEFVDNGFAVKVMANSMDNTFHHNNFSGNTFDVATNSRQNFNRFDGNYWSTYRGYDLDANGVGDVPHHPVRLFALLIEKEPPGIILMHSLFVRMIDTAERVMPAVTPETLVDERPLMRPGSADESSAMHRAPSATGGRR
jgi:nitrous oxidase accessory protein